MAPVVRDNYRGCDLHLRHHQHDRVPWDLPHVLLPAVGVHDLHDANLHPRRDHGLLPPPAASQLYYGQPSSTSGKYMRSINLTVIESRMISGERFDK